MKIFGVSVTDFEAESKELQQVASRFSSRTGKEEIAMYLRDVTELCRELNTRWFDVTQRIVTLQNELLASCAEPAKLEAASDTTEIEAARMEAGE
ncbi:MAG: hypothetical protein AAEJ52_06400 [Myxococcota bacterium]